MTQITFDIGYTRPQLNIFFKSSEKYNIITKGRRFGATKGAANAAIEWALEGKKILWGDTINSNIDRYFQRYIEPEIKRIDYSWSTQKKELRLLDGWIDFRSADRPENWEGFGYDIIILNEAGIILKNSYLYTNAVLPMLLDNPESQLFALGVPKGKYTRSGQKHIFFDLYEKGLNQVKGYRSLNYSSYDNPLLSKEEIRSLEKEINSMNPLMVQQEIYGEFIEGAFNALFEMEIINKFKVHHPPSMRKIIIAIDPAISNTNTSDETGIIVMGTGLKDEVFLLEDFSGKYSPREWSMKVQHAYTKWKANEVIAEVNQGGDMIEETIRISSPEIRVRKINASRGKYIRAEPVAAFYEQGKVHHVGDFPELESQMISWQGLNGEKSPDRLDAVVHGVTYLIGKSKSQHTKFSR